MPIKLRNERHHALACWLYIFAREKKKMQSSKYVLGHEKIKIGPLSTSGKTRIWDEQTVMIASTIVMFSRWRVWAVGCGGGGWVVVSRQGHSSRSRSVAHLFPRQIRRFCNYLDFNGAESSQRLGNHGAACESIEEQNTNNMNHHHPPLHS